jgi:hypothetical protein
MFQRAPEWVITYSIDSKQISKEILFLECEQKFKQISERGSSRYCDVP